MNHGGNGNPNPMNWVVTWLSIIMAIAVTFVATPQIHGLSVDWAVGYMDDNYGSWMVATGWFFWWIIVALLTFLLSVLLCMSGIMLGGFMITVLAGRFGR